MHEFQLINSMEAFNSIKKEWDELVEKHPRSQIFLTHDWIRCWSEIFVTKGTLLIYVYRENSKIKFIAPLMRSQRKYLKKIPKKTIHFLGIDRSDSHDFIYAAGYESLIPELIDALMLQYPKDILSLDSIIEDSPTLKELNNYSLPKGILSKIQNLSIPYILLDDMTAKSINKKNILRCRKHMEKDGNIEIKQIKEASDIEKYLPTLFEQHKQKWKNSQYNQKNNRDFYHKIAYMLNDLERLEFTVLLFNQQAIAMHFGFNFKDRYYYFKPTFDFDFAHHSPGNVLLIDIIKKVKEREFALFDFGKGEEAYKYRYTKNTNTLHNYLFYQRTWGNQSLFALLRLVKKIRAK